MAHPLPSQQHLKSLLDYDPSTGIVTWKPRVANGFKFSGKRAGSITRDTAGTPVGMAIVISGKTYRIGRIIWMLVHGVDPEDLEVDHKNRNPLDNRLENLRLATKCQNCLNRRRRSDSSSKLKGAILEGDLFKAVVTVNKNRMELGRFKTPEEAHEVYREAVSKLAGDFACFE